MRRALGAILAAALGCAALSAPTLPAEAAGQVSVRLRTAVKQLPVTAETRAGYDRDKFRHWIDADGDCRDTRDEVLAQESRTRTRGCDITRGRWVSYYDKRTWRRSSAVDIDHLVPLAEAWDSGAKRWNRGTRERFANDLVDRRSLVAVTDNVNQSKADRDPAQWWPRYNRCRYVRQWTAVKVRWSLRVNPAERRALVRQADRCRNTVLHVQQARIGTRAVGGGGGGGGGGNDPRFDTCGEAIEHGYGPYHRGRDAEYEWYRDSDSDGVVCES